MKYFKTGEKKGKIKKLMALLIAGTMLTCSVSYAAGGVIALSNKNLKRDLSDIKNYTNQSGFCTDDKGNLYFARHTNEEDPKNNKVRVYKLDTSGKQTVFIPEEGVYDNKGRKIKLGHANDMTYCPDDGNIYICCKGDNNTTNSKSNRMINIFQKNGSYYKDHCYFDYYFDKDGNLKEELGIRPSGIAYDQERKVFYLTRNSGGKYVVSVFELRNGTATAIKKDVNLNLTNIEKYTTQGITYKKPYLYVSLWEDKGQDNSLVVRYKVDNEGANFKFAKDTKNIKRFDQDNNTKTKFEIEGICFEKNNGNKLYMAVNSDSATKKNTDAIYTYTWK